MSELILSKAIMKDIPQIFELVNSFADEHMMLPRPLVSLYENIRDFVVARENNEIVGVGALHVLWKDLGEVRSLAVKKEASRRGIGRQIVEFLKEEARGLDIPELFALTYQKEFFENCGFELVSKDIFPHKVWTDCINCIKFPNCDELAMKLVL